MTAAYIVSGFLALAVIAWHLHLAGRGLDRFIGDAFVAEEQWAEARRSPLPHRLVSPALQDVERWDPRRIPVAGDQGLTWTAYRETARRLAQHGDAVNDEWIWAGLGVRR